MTHTVRLPKGWESIPLSDLVLIPKTDIVDGPFGSNLKASEYTDSGVPIMRLQNIGRMRFIQKNIRHIAHRKAEELSRHSFQGGDVVITKLGDPLGKACIVPADMVNGIIVADVVRARIEDALSLYVCYAINSPQVTRALSLKTKGTTRPRVNLGHIRALTLPIAPEGERARIVEAIESYLTRLDGAVASLERVQRNLERYRASVLKAAVEGHLVPTEAELAQKEGRSYEPASELLERILAERKTRWIEDAAERVRSKAEAKAVKAGKPWTAEDDAKVLDKARKTAEAKYKEPEAPDTTGLPNLPEGWCWVNPTQMFSWASGEFLPKKKQSSGDIPVYGGNGITGSHNEATVEVPTIVVGRVGALCGNVHLTDAAAWVTDNAIYASWTASLADLRFWTDILRTMNLNANAAGVGQPFVSQKHLNGLVLPMPPLSEQRRIAEETARVLSIAEGLDATILLGSVRCMRLRQSILKWAFEGKLVEQNPDDEPASALLERIKAEREAAEQCKPKSRKKKGRTQ